MVEYTECKYGGHSAGAQDESHESEVSQALMFCFDNAFQKSVASWLIRSLCFALPTRVCVPECHRNRVNSSTVKFHSLGYCTVVFVSWNSV